MTFPRTLLVSWQRPDGRYAGAEALRKLTGALPAGSVHWAYLAAPMPSEPEGSPPSAGFAPRSLHWRLQRRPLGYFYQHRWQAQALARRIAAWAADFNPQVIWALAELGAVNVAWRLHRLTGLPLHLTVHDDFNFARFSLPAGYREAYLRDAARLVRAAASLDAVSSELRDEVLRQFGNPPADRTSVVPPSIAARHVASEPPPRASDGVRRIALCGSMRVGEEQWRVFLDALSRLPVACELLAFVDRTSFFMSPLPRNVSLSFEPYAATEADLVRALRTRGAEAAYLGLCDRPEQRMFAGHSLSSKLVPYTAAGLPLIVHGPADSVAWRLASRYGAGVRCGADVAEAAGEMRRLLLDPASWRRASEGALRLCREEFDLERNVTRLADLLGKTAGCAA